MRVSENRRYLVDDNGKPFFYVAETSWRLFYELDRQEVEDYLANRKDKGFNVIMPVVIAEVNGERKENRYGFGPLIDGDPEKPCEAFFSHVDYVVDLANRMGIFVAMLPSWGEYVGPLEWGEGPILFDRSKAHTYGRFLGTRYADKDVFWVLGGDRRPEEGFLQIWRAMAEGIREGDGGRNLMTYHPSPDFKNDQVSSSEWIHHEEWLDFNMMQTSTKWDFPNYQYILRDYDKEPIKPTVDGETRYEYSHEFFWDNPRAGRRITAHQVRKAAYNAILSGAMGHTYGCRDVWSFYIPNEGNKPKRDVTLHWRQAMDLPGAYQMGYLKKLFTDYPWHQLIPDRDNTLLLYNWQEGGIYIPAALSESRDFALVYVSENFPIYIKPDIWDGRTVRAFWFNPRNGQYQHAGDYTGETVLPFTPPREDRDPDYVLVLKAL